MRTLVAQGFDFPEGPAFDPWGNLYVVDLRAGLVKRVRGDGEVETVLATGGGPNGAAWNSSDNTLTVCDAGLRRVLAVSPEGAARVLAEGFRGEPLKGPNDCAYDTDGNLYFTDPLGSSLGARTGRVLCLLRSGEVTLLDDGYAFSNGLAFGPDGALYVAESRTRRIYRYRLGVPGAYTEKSLFAELSGGRGPDGMVFDAEGKLYVAHAGKGCITVVDPHGAVVEEIAAGGDTPTNVAFGGPDGRRLYITEAETGSVYAVPVGAPGLPLP